MIHHRQTLTGKLARHLPDHNDLRSSSHFHLAGRKWDKYQIKMVIFGNFPGKRAGLLL